jgi:hypothetical protein
MATANVEGVRLSNCAHLPSVRFFLSFPSCHGLETARDCDIRDNGRYLVFLLTLRNHPFQPD